MSPKAPLAQLGLHSGEEGNFHARRPFGAKQHRAVLDVEDEACHIVALQHLDPRNERCFCLHPFVNKLFAVGGQPFGLVAQSSVFLSLLFLFLLSTAESCT